MSASSVISVRVSKNERYLLDEAANTARTNLSDYVRRQALDAAEISIMSCSLVSIAPEYWDELERWLDRPAKPNKALSKLARSKPAWA